MLDYINMDRLSMILGLYSPYSRQAVENNTNSNEVTIQNTFQLSDDVNDASLWNF